MIVGLVSSFAKEKEFFAPVLQRGLIFLRDTDFSKLSDGRYEIDGDNLFAMISTYTPRDKEDQKIENHERYIDIQYIISGEELMGYSNFSAATEIGENRLAESDAIFYKRVDKESDIKVLQGMYVIFFPWDIHRPACISVPDTIVRKAVLKLRFK